VPLDEAALAEGLNPSPPDLASRAVQAHSDAELHRIVSHGLRATGMPAFAPTHSPAELLALVGFVRHLAWLTEEQAAALAEAAPRDAQHHGPAGAPQVTAAGDHAH
jgi:mono/diheme cytochrome c family protein